jgi:hypothetical protein
MLLIVRALDTLGYEPTDAGLEMPLLRGGSLPVRGHGVDLAVSWRPDGTISIALEKRELTIVTVASNLCAGPSEQVRESLRQIHEATIKRKGGPVLVLFLASDDEKASADPELLAAIQTVGNDPHNILGDSGCLPISPWEIGSTERLARALRWFLSSARFSDYPQRVRTPQIVRRLIDLNKHSRWLESKDGGETLEFRRPPRDSEWALLHLTEIKRKGATALKVASSTSQLVEKTVHELVAALDEAYAKSVAILVCPTCGKTADPAHDFEPRDQGCFHCACSGCGTVWETRLCSNGHRYAAMLPSGDFVDTDDQRPGWEDRIYGCDILALPARKDNGRWGFICPECGQVS